MSSCEAVAWIVARTRWRYAVPAGHMGVYGGVIGLPWALKPVLGMLSDLCPIRGYAKAPYIIASALVRGESARLLTVPIEKAVTIQVRRYCNSSFNSLAVQFWLSNFGW